MTYTLEKEGINSFERINCANVAFKLNLERHIGFEPMTYTLARYRSTN